MISAETLLSLHIQKKNGRLYHYPLIWGFEHHYEVNNEEVKQENGTITYILEVDYVQDQRTSNDDLVYHFIKENGNWVVEELSIDDLVVIFNCDCPLCSS